MQLFSKNTVSEEKSIGFLNHLKVLATLSALALSILSFAQTGKWTQLKNLSPHQNMGVCLLMTDGTVICHNTDGPGVGTGWDRLTPDASGSYINGTWDSIAFMNNDRLFFSSQVLPSGKVYVAGGEYGAGGPEGGEVYDPVANTWTDCGPIPPGWNVYDGNSEILYDGTVLEGPQIGSVWSYNTLIWSPVTNQYTVYPNSLYNHDEAQWLKLRDSSVLFVGIASDYSNRYIPQLGYWINDDTVPGNIFDQYGEESGCALMLPNGKAIFFGATPYNAIYTPSGNTNPGKWTSADSFPIIEGTYMGQPDASGAMMVNGHILCAVSPIGTSSNEFNGPCYFVEYDYTTNKFTQVFDTIPGMGGDSIPLAAFQTQMLDLPDGNVLLSMSQAGGLSNVYYVYTPGSAPIPQGKPVINSIIADSCPNYKITGKLFNGISEGAAFGDDWQMETNYPIVRLTNGTNVYYAKTTNWNRIGAVQTDSLEDTAVFALPPALPGGTYSLVVVANGFASNPVLFTTFGLSTTESNIDCLGGAGMATANVMGTLTPYTYSWSPGGNTSQIVTGLSVGIYTVTVNDNNGCTLTAAVEITQPAAALEISIASNTDVSCFDGNTGSATSNSAIGGTGPYKYSWSPGGGTNLTETGLSAGTYTVTTTDNHGCTATASVTITQPEGMTITTDSVSAQSSSGSGCTGEASVTVVSGGTAPYTYSWTTNGQTTDTIKGQCPGDYCCIITDNNGCSQTTCVTIKNISGIENIKNGTGQIIIYPNPNKGIFTLQSSVIGGQSSLEIYNVLGQDIYSQSAIHNSRVSINLSSQPDGVYFYRVLNEDGSLLGAGKIVVEK